MRFLLDAIDLQIVRILRDNARMQWKQIGELVHLSGVAVANRIRRLEELGVIQGYETKVDEKKLGNSLSVFIVTLIRDYRHAKFREFLIECEYIKEAHRVSGELCYILRVDASGTGTLAELLDDILQYGTYQLHVSIDQCK
jgi:Lrp/AsnC family transcriptional regulator, leucine-responsive regulatory protein